MSTLRKWFSMQRIRTRLPLYLTSGLLHFLGIALVYVAIWWLMLPPETHKALHEAASYGLFVDQPHALLFHGLLSACFWVLLVLVVQVFKQPAEQRQLRLVRARGTVIVETLIVLPVFLLITLGLLQLTILNTAGLLTSLGAFKAGRAVSVWAPEADEGRLGVNYSIVDEKARLAAASAVTPVAPSDFVHSCTGSTSLDAKLDAIRSVGHATSMNPNMKAHGSRSNLSVSRAFDHSNFLIRGQSKLSFAWCATEVVIEPAQPRPAERFTVTVIYQQQMAMPFVEVVFGDFREVAGRTGFYTQLERSYSTTAQIKPNRTAPGLF